MSTRKPNKSLYKIYLVDQGKYYSNYRKATWVSIHWVLEAASDLVYRKRSTADQVQIHEFPVVDAIKHDYKAFLETYQDEARKKEEKRKIAREEYLAKKSKQVKELTIDQISDLLGFEVKIVK